MSLVFLLLSLYSYDYSSNQENYIKQYTELATIEMQRTGVPASIKLAQGILESNSGISEFAQKSNNHFGIKCKSWWKGKTYYHKDDDYDKSGQLLESCFRAYDRVVESYVDHSNFLKFGAHYQHLFSIPTTDYKSWATGLKLSGYATDPSYDIKLIKLIEKYKLNELDQPKW